MPSSRPSTASAESLSSGLARRIQSGSPETVPVSRLCRTGCTAAAYRTRVGSRTPMPASRSGCRWRGHSMIRRLVSLGSECTSQSGVAWVSSCSTTVQYSGQPPMRPISPVSHHLPAAPSQTRPRSCPYGQFLSRSTLTPRQHGRYCGIVEGRTHDRLRSWPHRGLRGRVRSPGGPEAGAMLIGAPGAREAPSRAILGRHAAYTAMPYHPPPVPTYGMPGEGMPGLGHST